MNLEDFIATTLTQIIGGVRRAQTETKDANGGGVNPRPSSIPHNLPRKGMNPLQTVHFDVAVTASESSSISAGGGIRVLAIELGTRANTGDEASSVTRIRFSVPIALPEIAGDGPSSE